MGTASLRTANYWGNFIVSVAEHVLGRQGVCLGILSRVPSGLRQRSALPPDSCALFLFVSVFVNGAIDKPKHLTGILL